MRFFQGYGVTLTATWILPVALIPGTWYERDFPKSPTPNSPIPLPHCRPFPMQSFVPPTPTMSTTEHDIPTSVYDTPMSSVFLGSPPVPDIVLKGENEMFDPTLVSSSTPWSPFSPPPPISSPIHYPTTIPANSFSSPSFTPNTPTSIIPHPSAQAQSPTLVPISSPRHIRKMIPPNSMTSVIPHPIIQPQPPTSTCYAPLSSNSSLSSSSPRSRTPRFSSWVRSSSPSISSNGNGTIPTPLIIHDNNNNNNNLISPLSPTSAPIVATPMPMPPTPIELPPIPPEVPFSPTLVDQLLRGPVLQIVPLPDVE